MTDRDSAVNTVRLIRAIEVSSLFGAGTESDPYHTVTEWFLPDGTRIGRKGSIEAAHYELDAIFEAMKHQGVWKPGARIEVKD